MQVSSRSETQVPSAASPPDGVSRSGLVYAIAAYGLWGFLPIYFIALAPSGPVEIVAWRVLFSLVFCALLILVTRAWRALAVLLRDRRIVLTMGLAGVLIFINWQTYVIPLRDPGSLSGESHGGGEPLRAALRDRRVRALGIPADLLHRAGTVGSRRDRRVTRMSRAQKTSEKSTRHATISTGPDGASAMK